MDYDIQGVSTLDSSDTEQHLIPSIIILFTRYPYVCKKLIKILTTDEISCKHKCEQTEGNL